MPYETYIAKRFSSGSAEVIDNANRIIEEYRSQGFVLNVRQIYYQFVARAIRLYEQEPGETEASSRFGLYVRRWVRWTNAGLPIGVVDINRRRPVTTVCP